MIRRLLAIAAFACTTPAIGQVPQKALPISGPVVVPAATDRVDDYYFFGAPGERRMVTITTTGRVAIDVLDAQGDVVATANGTGRVAVEFIPSYADTYLLTVARTGPARGYTLSSRSTVPTAAEAGMAWNAGYRSVRGGWTQCWVRPGIHLRMIAADGRKSDTILSASRQEIVRTGDATDAGSTYTTTLTDAEYVTERTMPDGRVVTNRRPLSDYLKRFGGMRFAGNICTSVVKK